MKYKNENPRSLIYISFKRVSLKKHHQESLVYMQIYLIILTVTSNYINFIQNRINKNINALEDVKGLKSLDKDIFDFYAHLSRLILYLIPFYHHVMIVM